MNAQTNENLVEINWEQLVQQIHELLSCSATTPTSPSVPLLYNPIHSLHQIEEEKESIFKELTQVLRSPFKTEPKVASNAVPSSNSNSPLMNTVISCPNSPFQLADVPPPCNVRSLSMTTAISSSSSEKMEHRVLSYENKFKNDETAWNRKRRRHFSDAEIVELQEKLQNTKRTKFVRKEHTPFQKMVQIFKFK